MRVTTNRLATADVLVVGPTLHGVSIALESARDGRRTVLAMRTTSPAAEIGSSMGAWLTDDEASVLPADMRTAILTGAQTGNGTGGSSLSLLHQTAALTAVEDLLLDAGVRVFYDLHAVGLLTDAGRAAGVLFAGTFGTAAITAAAVIDCTPDARLVRWIGPGRWVDAKEADEYAATVLTDGDTWHDHLRFTDTVTVAQRGPLAEFRFGDATGSPELAVRRSVIARLDSWCAEHPAEGFRIERAGDELLVDPARRLASDGAAGPVVTGLEGLFCVGPAADLNHPNGYLDLRTRYVVLARRLLGELPDRRCRLVEPASYVLLDGAAVDMVTDDATATGTVIGLADPSFDEPSVDSIPVELDGIPILRRADLVVLGGGTCGAEAARAAGRLGIDVLCVEKHSDVGGVSTVGGVPAYWFGRRTPFFKRFHAALKKNVREKRLPVPFALLDMIDESGASILLRTPMAGVVRRDDIVTHVLCATRDGLRAVEGRYFIDASGDGSLAAMGGAPYTYGSQRDEITLWSSFGSFHAGRDEASRQYMSVVDQRSAADTARGIIAGRRMGGISHQGRYVQHYLACRESRHILGGTTVTYHDVMMERAFPDAVMYCKSNIDMKGMASSRAAMCGYVEKSFLQNYEASIPLRALTPPTIDNLLVVGKAYSITHDGISMARMQPDMISLGAVASTVAHHALCERRVPTDPARNASIDVAALQRSLEAQGILLPGDLPSGPMDERVPPNDEGLVEIMERLNSKPVEPSEWARILARPQAARRTLDRRGIITSEWVLPQIDLLAATLGDRSANERLLKRLDSMLEAEQLPGASGLEQRHDVPDHGFAPQPVFLMNAISWTRDVRLVSRLERVESLLRLDPTVCDYRFSYVHAIAYAAELLAVPAAGAVAERTMDRPAIAGSLLRRGEADPRQCVDYIAERYAYLGLCLARGAARCGLAAGYARLAEYTGEIRLYLARSARRELVELLCADHGFDPGAWRTEIDAYPGPGPRRPRPYTTVHA